MMFFSNTTLAFESFPNTENDLVLYSEDCPVEAENYALESYTTMLQAAIDSGDIIVNGDVSLGSPFTILDSKNKNTVYYFPILNNNTVIATFRVYVDDILTLQSSEPVYIGILSKYLVAELNELWKTENRDLGAVLYFDNGNIMIQIENEVNTLIPSINGNSPTKDLIDFNFSELKITSINNNLDTVNISDFQSQNYSYTANLQLPIIETQFGNKWCSAYATASIMRFLTGNTNRPRALDLMVFVNKTELTDSFETNDIFEYLEYYGGSATDVSRPLTSTEVFGEINARRPVFAGLTSPSENHAVVIIGYNRNTNTYSIWNPWYSYYETINMITKEYASPENGTYEWKHSIYQWNV